MTRPYRPLGSLLSRVGNPLADEAVTMALTDVL